MADLGKPIRRRPSATLGRFTISFSRRLADYAPVGVSLLLMPRGGRREGAGRPKGSGNGRTVEIRSVSMLPESWQKLDELRGSSRNTQCARCGAGASRLPRQNHADCTRARSDGGVESEVEVIQRTELAEVGSFVAPNDCALLSHVDFVLENSFEELGVWKPVGFSFLEA
jgi:hypothetical protein